MKEKQTSQLWKRNCASNINKVYAPAQFQQENMMKFCAFPPYTNFLPK